MRLDTRFLTDYAKDNLWIVDATSNAFKITSVTNPKSNDAVKKLEKQVSSVNKGDTITGRIFYFLPKNAKGAIVSKPVRVLRQIVNGQLTDNFYQAKDFVAQSPASSFTGLDDLRREMDYYGVQGELSNMQYLDESISNMMCNSNFTGYSGMARAKRNTNRFVLVKGRYQRGGLYPKGTVKRVVDVATVPFYCMRRNENQMRNLLIFDDGTAGAPNKWQNLNSKYSNLTNESLLDGLTENTSLLEVEGGYSNLTNESLLDGLTENTSLLEAEGGYSNLTNESLLDGLTENTSLLEFEANNQDFVPAKNPTPYVVTVTGADGDKYIDADGEMNYSNAIGDWFKGLFAGKKKLNAIPALADPTVFVVDAETMQKAYEESGSPRTYREWLDTDNGKAVVSAVAQFANILVNKPDTNLGGGGFGDGDFGAGDKPLKSETKILGMSPITFGLVALGVIAIGSIVAYRVIKSKNIKK